MKLPSLTNLVETSPLSLHKSITRGGAENVPPDPKSVGPKSKDQPKKLTSKDLTDKDDQEVDDFFKNWNKDDPKKADSGSIEQSKQSFLKQFKTQMGGKSVDDKVNFIAELVMDALSNPGEFNTFVRELVSFARKNGVA